MNKYELTERVLQAYRDRKAKYLGADSPLLPDHLPSDQTLALIEVLAAVLENLEDRIYQLVDRANGDS